MGILDGIFEFMGDSLFFYPWPQGAIEVAEQQRDDFQKIMKEGYLPLLREDTDELALPKLMENEGVIVAAVPRCSFAEETSGRDFIASSAAIAKGWWIHGGRSIVRKNIQIADTGALFLSNLRMVFFGKKRTLNISLDNILGVYFDEDKNNMFMRVHEKNREQAYLFYHPVLKSFKIVLEALPKENWELGFDENGEPVFLSKEKSPSSAQKKDGNGSANTSQGTHDSSTVSETSTPDDYRSFLRLNNFKISCMIRNKGDRTVGYLVIKTQWFDSQDRVVYQKLYKVIPYGAEQKPLRPGHGIKITTDEQEVPESAIKSKVGIHEVRLA